MKMTLLEMTQDILNSMDSDEVNSHTDTQEAVQVAQIIKTTFYELIARKEWTHLSKLTTLTSVGSSTYPNYLKIPENTQRLDYFLYDVAENTETRLRMEGMYYLHPDEFLARQNQLNNDNSNVVTITDFDGIKYNIYNDRAPKYYTSFDDVYVVTDAYDSVKESTLQGANSQAKIYEIPSWTMDDNFTPDLPAEAFSLLLAEAKSVCFVELKQMANEKAEQQAQRQSRYMSQRGRRGNSQVRYPNYGRRTKKTNGYRGNPYIDKETYSGP